MAMSKFPSLAIGQRFLFRGAYYVKVSPLLARAEDSGQSQMIPRSAQVDLLDAPPAGADTPEPIQAAVDDLHSAALDCLEELANISAAPPQALAHARKQLDVARRRVLAKLGVGD